MKIDELVKVMKKLRAPDGCPWDRAQTHQSLMPFIMDECGELLDAIEAQDDANFREELGDVLMHIVLHSVMAEERGAFTFDDVVEGITAKMISRHPHVFGKEAVSSARGSVTLAEETNRPNLLVPAAAGLYLRVTDRRCKLRRVIIRLNGVAPEEHPDDDV